MNHCVEVCNMNCLKCGKETAQMHTFCDECLADMESAPVKPGTPIHLPHRNPPQEKKGRNRMPSTAETISSLKSMIRWLTATVAILAVIICLLTSILLRTIGEQNAANLIGKNYTTTTDITTQP